MSRSLASNLLALRLVQNWDVAHAIVTRHVKGIINLAQGAGLRHVPFHLDLSQRAPNARRELWAPLSRLKRLKQDYVLVYGTVK